MLDAPYPDGLSSKPIIFISYASADRARADVLHTRLTQAGFETWFDRTRLEPGMRWHQQIDEACEAARVVLPLITPRWATSAWTRYETYVHDAIIPVLAEGDPKETLTPPLRHLQAITLDPATAGDDSWRALFDAIRRLLDQPQPEKATRAVDLPYAANPFFAGRETELVALHDALHATPVAALTQARVSALAAMGGIGKTTLANEYARRYWRLYPQILWVDARRGYRAEFARLFDRLFPEQAAASPSLIPADVKAAHALATLNSSAHRLLVIDNVEDPESVRPWLPREATSGCRTLITSRFADWPAQEGVHAIHLYVLDPEPARTFLLHRTGLSADGEARTSCDTLAKELGYLPLALEQAGAYIAANPGVSFADYLRFLVDAGVKLLHEGHRGSTEYPEPVLRTWRTTIGKLSPESRAVLWLCAWYADTPIPRALIVEGADDVVKLAEQFGPMRPLGETDTADERRMLDALAGLRRYSMLVFDQADASFRMHGLVQAVERMDLATHGLDDATKESALKRLVASFPDAAERPDLWPLCRRLVPHLHKLTERLGDGSDAPLSTLLDRAGSFLLAAGSAQAALPLFDRLLRDYEQTLGREHGRTIYATNKRVLALEALGRAQEALPLRRWILAHCDQTYGKDHPDTIVSVFALAKCLGALLGNSAEALPLFQRAAAAYERDNGIDHISTLKSLGGVALCLQRLDNAKAALPIHNRVLDAHERLSGPNHPETLITVTNLASCLQALGDPHAAVPLYRRAFNGRERLFGEEHPDTLVSLSNLGHGLDAAGNSKEALPLHKRALGGRERVLGKDHPDTISSVNNLAYCLQNLDDTKQALPLFRRAFDDAVRVFGKDHPNTIVSTNNLAHCLEMLGDRETALPLYRRAVEDAERRFGPNHSMTLGIKNNLNRCERFRHTVSGQAASPPALPIGPADATSLASLYDYAATLEKQGGAAAALPLFERGLGDCERVLGAEHLLTQRFRAMVGLCRWSVPDYLRR